MCDLPEQVPFLVASLKNLRWGSASGADSYSLEISKNNGSTWTVLPQQLNSLSTTLPKLIANTDYAFRIRAKNTCGFGDYSPIAYRRTPVTSNNVFFLWSTPVRVEPNLQEGISGDWIKHSELATLNINEQTTITFAKAEINGILVISQENIEYENDADGVTFTLPQNCIILGNTGTHQDEKEETVGFETVVISNKAAKKTFVEKISGKKYVLDDSGIDGFSAAGFTTAKSSEGLDLQLLRSKNFVSNKGIFTFRLSHIVSGSGYANVKIATSTSKSTEIVVVNHGDAWVGPLMTAVQNENSVKLN
jgi:hypothetical protein